MQFRFYFHSFAGSFMQNVRSDGLMNSNVKHKHLKIMRPAGKIGIATMAAAIVLSCGTANAQRWHRHFRPYHVMTVVSRPVRTFHLTNSFTQKERFGMAMAYLDNHGYLTVKKYAQMTGLPKTAAEAELDAFAADKDNPVTAVIRDGKKVYVTKDGNCGL